MGLLDNNASLGIFGQNANFSGGNMSVPTAASNNTPAIGGSSNPLVPQFPGGTTTPGQTSSINMASVPSFPANGTPNAPGSDPGAAGGTLPNPATLLGQSQGGSWAPNQNDFIKAMRKAGFSAGDAGMLWNFLQGGAGYNPQVAQALFAQMQPQIARGEADIMELFGSKGMSNSSSATAIAMGDYLSQVNLNEQAINAGLYQNAVQNYMSVLMGGKGPAPQNFFQSWMEWMKNVNSGAVAAAAGGA